MHLQQETPRNKITEPPRSSDKHMSKRLWGVMFSGALILKGLCVYNICPDKVSAIEYVIPHFCSSNSVRTSEFPFTLQEPA